MNLPGRSRKAEAESNLCKGGLLGTGDSVLSAPLLLSDRKSFALGISGRMEVPRQLAGGKEQ